MFRYSSIFTQLLFVLLLASALLPGCNSSAKQQLIGVYHRQPTGAPVFGEVQQVEITANKVIVNVPLAGEIASDYSLEGNRIYVGGQPGQLIFNVDGPGTISNQGNLGIMGTYVKQ